MMDTLATPDQLHTLVENHEGVEDRNKFAYQTAVSTGNNLRAAVLKHRGVDMSLQFVSEEHARNGFTSSTYSFNLPSPEGATEEEKECLAQKFVDMLTAAPQFKPCVSFGQDNE